MPSLSPKSGVRYTKADLDSVAANSLLLEFIHKYDPAAKVQVETLHQAHELYEYIATKRQQTHLKKPAKPQPQK